MRRSSSCPSFVFEIDSKEVTRRRSSADLSPIAFQRTRVREHQPTVHVEIGSDDDISQNSELDEATDILTTSTYLSPAQFYTLVDSHDGVQNLLDEIDDVRSWPPAIFVDVDGPSLGRTGTISTITLLIEPIGRIYIIDLLKIGEQAFRVSNESGHTLQHMFENPHQAKVFFDARSPSDAMYNVFGVTMAGIYEIQLMEFAVRKGKKGFLKGMSKCVRDSGRSAVLDAEAWIFVKDRIRGLAHPACSVYDDLLRERPMRADQVASCILNVVCLPHLWQIYFEARRQGTMRRVSQCTLTRLEKTRSSVYQGQGKHMVLAPW